MVLGDEELSQCTEQKFNKAASSIVFSSYVSALTVVADVVFPVANWLEQNGHFINFDGHILEEKAALLAPEGVFSNLEALEKLSAVLGAAGNIKWEDELKAFASPVAIA